MFYLFTYAYHLTLTTPWTPHHFISIKLPLAAELADPLAQQPGVALPFWLWIVLAGYVLVIYTDKVMECC